MHTIQWTIPIFWACESNTAPAGHLPRRCQLLLALAAQIVDNNRKQYSVSEHSKEVRMEKAIVLNWCQSPALRLVGKERHYNQVFTMQLYPHGCSIKMNSCTAVLICAAVQCIHSVCTLYTFSVQQYTFKRSKTVQTNTYKFRQCSCTHLFPQEVPHPAKTPSTFLWIQLFFGANILTFDFDPSLKQPQICFI